MSGEPAERLMPLSFEFASDNEELPIDRWLAETLAAEERAHAAALATEERQRQAALDDLYVEAEFLAWQDAL